MQPHNRMAAEKGFSSMRLRRSKFYLSLSLLLLATGSVFSESIPELRDVNFWQRVKFPSSRLTEQAALCQKNSDEARGCLRALRTLLNAKTEHLALENNAIQIVPGFMHDESELSLEKKMGNSATRDAISFPHLFQQTISTAKPDSELVASAFNSWLSALDPHSHLVPATKTEAESYNSEDEILGIGAHLRRYHDSLYVIAVIPGSEAARHGIKMGDQILRINHHDTILLSAHDRELLMRDALDKHDNLELTILRGSRSLHIKTPAERVLIQNVEENILRDANGTSLGILKVHSFAKENTCTAVAQSLRNFEKKGVHGIALDLRNNPGGFVRQAVCVSGLLLGPDVLVASFDRITEKNPGLIPGNSLGATQDLRNEFSLYTSEQQISRRPLFVLVNQNTASAAEIVAAALQDHRRARVLGARTFGKGSMQSAFQAWGDKEVYLYRTTHLIVRPSGKGLQRLGVNPDFVLRDSHFGKSFREANLYDNALQSYRPIATRALQPASGCEARAIEHSGSDALSASRALLRCSE